MGNSICLRFDSSIENIKDVNESFSSGVLRICYTGVNRNGSMISKSSIERALPTMFNCPIVCNYDIESDSIGGHDMDVVQTEDGSMRLVNLTSAIGVIPAGANTWWSTIEDNGREHEYLMAEAILWKRSPAYQKIAEDGITSQSMEISVRNGQMQDGVFAIDDFAFTAFCLLGDDVEPCFESASLQMFGKDDIKQQFVHMMQEFKEAFSKAQFSKEVGIYTKNYSEGGDEVLEQKTALMAEFGLAAEDLDFNVEDFTVDELRVKFEAMKQAAQNPSADTGDSSKFALAEQFREELCDALSAEKVETCFGEVSRYMYVDYDSGAMEVYCYDYNDWKLYGFSYSMNGDNVIVDFEGKKRKKFSIVDFDEGEQPAVFASILQLAEEKFNASEAKWAEKYQTASDTISSMEKELGVLRQFKTDTESSMEKGKRNEVFAQFEDLVGVEAFESLREHCMDYALDVLEEKCYAIRGRKGTAAKFAYEAKSPKLPVERVDSTELPYGGIFEQYGIHTPEKNN